MKHVAMILAALTLAACAADPAGQASLVKADQAQLRAIRVDAYGSDVVPPAAQSGIEALKDHLAAVTQDYLTSRSDRSQPDPAVIEAGLMVLLGANKPELYQVQEPSADEVDNIYGSDLKVKVTASPMVPNLLLVQYDFGIACGDDGMLLAYEWQAGVWVPQLRWQAKPYTEISEAFGDGFQSVVISDEDKEWQIASVHGYPWCSSNLSAFDVDVLKPSDEYKSPKIIFHKKKNYRRDSLELSTSPNGFSIKAPIDSLDADIMGYPAIFRYRVTDDKVERVPPLATNARDFVDQWIQAPWDEAQNWSASENLPGLKRIYDILQRRDDIESSNGLKYFEYDKMRGCSADRQQVQLDWGLWIGEKGMQEPSQPIYFQVDGKGDQMRMQSASFKADPACRHIVH